MFIFSIPSQTMAKGITPTLPAFFIAVFLVITTTATTYTTTTITTTTNNETPINSKCKIERGEIKDCLIYLSPEGDFFLDECCSQLEEFKSECQCKALKEVVWQIEHQRKSDGYGMTPEEKKQIQEIAQDLPRRCYLDFSGSCTIMPDQPAATY